MDQRNNQPMEGVEQPTNSLRPPVGYPPQSTAQVPYVQPPYPPQPPMQPYDPTQTIYPPQTIYPGQDPTQQQAYPTQMGGMQPVPPQDDFAQPTGFQIPQGPIKQPREMPKWFKTLRTAMILLAVGGAVWFLYERFVPNAEPYGIIETGTLGANYTGDCVIVRDETPYDAEGVTSVNHLAEEAVTVRYSLDICEVYSSGYSTREMNTLQEYRDAIRDYQKQLLETETTYDARMTRVQNDVVSRAKDIRSIIAGARGSLTNQQSLMQTAVATRQQYLRSKYSDDQRLSRLYDDETSQLQRIQSWTKKYVSPRDAIVSFYSDAYEYGLNSQNYTTFTPAQVRSMFNGQRPDAATDLKGKTTIYRLVQDGSWYVLFLAREKDWNPIKGQTYELRLERFQETTVMARVEDFVRSGGELLLQLSVQGSVSDILYMRTCQAELGESISTLRVPERAIYQQDDMDVVIVVSGGAEGYIPVNVLRYEEGYAYITPVQQGLLFEGQQIRLF